MVHLIVAVLGVAGGAIAGYLLGGVVAPAGEANAATYRTVGAVIGGVVGGVAAGIGVALARRRDEP
jgi:hypothetical protein